MCGGGGGGGVLTGNCSLSIASLLMDQTNTSYFSVRNNPPLVCSVALSGANCSSCGSPVVHLRSNLKKWVEHILMPLICDSSVETFSLRN